MKMNEKTVLVAISGGVDSAVAAGMLLQAGYDVTGLFLHPCGHGDDAADTQHVAERLGIELINLDVSEDFARIIDYFVDEYASGRTPNPCIRCNRFISSPTLSPRQTRLAFATSPQAITPGWRGGTSIGPMIRTNPTHSSASRVSIWGESSFR